MIENRYVAHKLYILLSSYGRKVSIRQLFKDHQSESWITSLPHWHDVIKHYPALFQLEKRLVCNRPVSLEMLAGYLKLPSNVGFVGYFKIVHKNWTKLTATVDIPGECLLVQGLGGTISASASSSHIDFVFSLPKNQGSIRINLKENSFEEFLEMFPSTHIVVADLAFTVTADNNIIVNVVRIQKCTKEGLQPIIWIVDEDGEGANYHLVDDDDDAEEEPIAEPTAEDNLLAFNLVLWFRKMEFGVAGIFNKQQIVDFVKNNIESLSGRKYRSMTNNKVVAFLISFPLLFKSYGQHWSRVVLETTENLADGILSLVANIELVSEHVDPVIQDPRITVERSVIVLKNVKGYIVTTSIDGSYYAIIPSLKDNSFKLLFMKQDPFTVNGDQLSNIEIRVAVNCKQELIACVVSVDEQPTQDLSKHISTLQQLEKKKAILNTVELDEDMNQEAIMLENNFDIKAGESSFVVKHPETADALSPDKRWVEFWQKNQQIDERAECPMSNGKTTTCIVSTATDENHIEMNARDCTVEYTEDDIKTNECESQENISLDASVSDTPINPSRCKKDIDDGVISEMKAYMSSKISTMKEQIKLDLVSDSTQPTAAHDQLLALKNTLFMDVRSYVFDELYKVQKKVLLMEIEAMKQDFGRDVLAVVKEHLKKELIDEAKACIIQEVQDDEEFQAIHNEHLNDFRSEADKLKKRLNRINKELQARERKAAAKVDKNDNRDEINNCQRSEKLTETDDRELPCILKDFQEKLKENLMNDLKELCIPGLRLEGHPADIASNHGQSFVNDNLEVKISDWTVSEPQVKEEYKEFDILLNGRVRMRSDEELVAINSVRGSGVFLKN